MTDAAPERVLAAVDIGTNSVHMVVARIGAGGRVDVLTREKEVVRLGRSGGDMKQLAPDAIDRGVAALQRCRRVADAHGAEVAAVATSAVREAENRAEFIDRARDEAGILVEVISGFEEARLIHLGVLQALPVFDQRLLLWDIGGGSTEVLLGQRGEVLTSRSFRLGAIRMTERFLAGPAVTADDVERCRQHAEITLAPFGAEVRDAGYDVVVGASGTIETVVAMARAARGEANGLRTLNGQRVAAEEVTAVVDALAAAPDAAARASLPGMDPKRADIMLGGAVVLEQLVGCFGVRELVFSENALREGVLLDQARRRSGGSLHQLQDLRRRSVVRLMERADDQPDHARETARLALQLYDQLLPLLELDEPVAGESRPLLEGAALLANVGVSISHSGHHKHSYYVIRNSQHLAGFTDREIEVMAQVARYHRKSAPKAKHPEWAELDPEDRDVVRSLAAVLRVAIGLDRSHGARVGSVEVSWDDEAISIVLHPAGEAPVDLEVHAADQRSGLLAEVTGREVVVRAVEVQPT